MEPTHPHAPVFPHTGNDRIKGLTKREYFAAAALTGLLANDKTSKLNAPHQAVEIADTVIKFLSRGGE